jgi:HD-GYP domain-containing protein (c-di-GMP phosphodiesterase class II)
MPNNQLLPAPAFKHISDASHLVHLRSKVAPILSNRILTHFTDHSVTHSDNLARYVDELVESLQSTPEALTDQEVTVLYAACYLHDIGMHYENAGDTDAIKRLALSQD